MSANRARPRFFTHVYRLVRKVPCGKVVTYGQVAAMLGAPRAARAVGSALRHLPRPLSQKIPWQRVINASGGISLRGDVDRVEHQRWLLENEGVEFDRNGKVDLHEYRWRGPKRWKTPGWEDWTMIGGAEDYFNDMEFYNKMGLEFALAYTMRISSLPVIIDFGSTGSGPTAIQLACIAVPALASVQCALQQP